MIEFRTQLQAKLEELCREWVGPGTDPQNFVKTFDDHLHDIPYAEMPFIVINVRTAELADSGEMGVDFDLYEWTVHIYYLDISEEYDIGDQRRNRILAKVEKNLEKNRFLENLQTTDTDGSREYVFDSRITNVLFDYSGQEEYHSFVSELYVTVYTARS